MKKTGTLVIMLVMCATLAAAGNARGESKAGAGAARKAEAQALKEQQARWAVRKAQREASQKALADRMAKKAAWRKKIAEQRVNQRQSNQDKRIAHGVKKGYLTDDEVNKLQAQQASIRALEESALADGKMSRDEFTSLRKELNSASAQIWAEKHDGDGRQMPTYRFGKDVFAKDELTSKITDGSMTPDEARKVMRDMHRLMDMKRRLASDTLSDEEREAMRAEYDELLDDYYEVR